MTELTEAEQQKLNTGRLLMAQRETILPLLQTKERLVIGKIVSAFKAGQLEMLSAHAAELTTLYDMKMEITQKITAAEALEKKLYDDDSRHSER
jgi:hypothetical protein